MNDALAFLVRTFLELGVHTDIVRSPCATDITCSLSISADDGAINSGWVWMTLVLCPINV